MRFLITVLLGTAHFTLCLTISKVWTGRTITTNNLLSIKEKTKPRTIVCLQENDNVSAPTSTSKLSSQCPFSKSFPRYRIDLTRFKKRKEQSWFASSFKNISRSLQRSKLEQHVLLRNEFLLWEPKLDGIAATSFLWENAAQLLLYDNDQDNSYNASQVIVIALPDASKQLVQNWIEIIDWMGMNAIPHKMEPALTASLILDPGKASSSGSKDDDDWVPSVRIQRISKFSTAMSLPLSTNISSTTKPNSLDVILRTQAWVKRILVQQGICPFTKSIRKSGQGLSDLGVPVGIIAYHESSASHPVFLFADTWSAILKMIQAGPSGKDGISSILLSAPAFDDDFDFWAGPVFAMLEAGVVSARAEGQIGVVCFHPKYATPDGQSWPGFGHMHSVPRLEKWHKENTPEEIASSLSTEDIAAGGAWQRRTPHATINVLRADQLEAAESRRSSGKMYAENIEKLVGKNGIGSRQLAQDLAREQCLRNS